MPSSDESPAPTALPAGARRLMTRFGRGGVILLATLGVLLVSATVFSIKAENPWGRTVEKRIEKKQALTPKEYAVIGLWWGAVVNAGLLALLLAGAGKWVPQGSTDIPPEVPAGGSRVSRRFALILLLAAIALAAWLRAPLLGHSLWNDEEYAMRRFAHGAWEQQKDGTRSFEPATWTDTLFENRHGNNHLLNSLIMRSSLDAWRAITGSPRDAFSESALRAPFFAAGLLTVAMVFLLGSRAGGPLVGIGAAFLLALCPWHVRYAVEARGYSFLLLFICTAIYGLVRAIESNKVRWWLVFALSEAAFLLSFAGSVYVAAALNVFAAIELIGSGRAARVWTLAGFNVLAAVPVIQWNLPGVPQLLNYIRSEGALHINLGWPWLRDFFAGLAIGFQYDNSGEHAGTSWLMETAAHPWLAPFGWVAAALLLAGILTAFFQNTAARLAIAAPALAVVGAYSHSILSGTPMFPWYLIYALVPAALAVPLALSRLTGSAAAAPRGRLAGPVFLAAFLLAWAAATHGANERLRGHARQPMREAVAFARAHDANALTAVLGVSDKQIASYDPRAGVLDGRQPLAALTVAARREGKSLFVYVCGRETIVNGADDKQRSKQPVLDALDHGLRADEAGGTAATFREAARFLGTETMFSYRVYQMAP